MEFAALEAVGFKEKMKDLIVIAQKLRNCH